MATLFGDDPVDLQAAIEAFRLRQARASNRQEDIQRWCCTQLRVRGIEGAEIEVEMPGDYRSKAWDVGVMVDGEPRLGISCKSIISNHSGTVPNRIDDMLGEAVNLHRHTPAAVLGWLFMMSRIDESKAKRERRERQVARGRPLEEINAAARADGDGWFAELGDSVSRASGRTGPDDLPEKFEEVSCSLFDFDEPPPYPVQYHPNTLQPDDFFDRLVEIYRERFG